jgi:glycosyltransferase involved in cell wall biosynthesis
MKKKILHILKYYYPYIGGIENIGRYIAEELTNYENIVLCFNEKKENTKELIHKLTVYRVGTSINVARQSLSFSYYFILKRILQEEKIDLIHFHCPNPFVAALLIYLIPDSVKLILHWHLDIVNQKKIYFFIKPIEKKLLKRADKILVTSSNYLEHSSPLHNYRYKSSILPNYISIEKLILNEEDKIKIAKLSSVYNNKKIVFFLGRHVAYKGIEYLIKAEKYIRSDCVIIIAGNGPLTEKLKQITTSKRIEFIGEIPDEEVKVYMHTAVVFAFPSITKNEAFGLALAEAMYCKAVPVTFTIDGSGVNWVNLKDVTGLEVENKNEKQFGEAIDCLLKDEELRTKLTENGYWRVVNNFTPNVIKFQIESIYKSLMLKS